jgi:hypothetical protein
MTTTRQGDLFATAAAPAPPDTPDPEAIRARLHAMLALVRDAREMPWEPSRVRVQEHLFMNMATWLPSQECETLRQAFAAEMRRLRVNAARPPKQPPDR